MFVNQPTQDLYNAIIRRGVRAVPTYAEVKRDSITTAIDTFTLA